MGGIRRGSTLFEQVPALGGISAQGAGIAKLIPIQFGQGQERAPFTLKEGVTRVGREPANDWTVLAPQVSRYHCEISFHGGQVSVKDLGSGNGTFINKARITESKLNPGDELWISPQRIFRLVMDEEMQRPENIEVKMEDPQHGVSGIIPSASESTSVAPNQHPQSVDDDQDDFGAPTRGASAHDFAHLKPEEPKGPTLEQVERQRNVLAILYQITLRCMLTRDPKEIEELLTNVVRRLAKLDSGFILYRSGSSFRATVVPTQQRAPQETVWAVSKFGLTLPESAVISGARELQQIGLFHGSALLVPLQLEGENVGVIACISNETGVYDEEVVDVVSQLANVIAAALVGRPY